VSAGDALLMPDWLADDGGAHRELTINGERMAIDAYLRYHRQRIAFTLAKVDAAGRRRVVEVGGHPWVMTASLVDHPSLQLCATVSAEEVSDWPDDIGLTQRTYHIVTPGGAKAAFPNYSANIERRVFDIAERPDIVLACEIVEHLIRSPHVMFLNINRWLSVDGALFVTTPNGAQFANPLRRVSRSPAYRDSVYSRHNYLYTLDLLVDLIELCGFRVIEAGYCNVISRRGPSRAYDVLSRFPGRYWREKFSKTIHVMAHKQEDVVSLARHPRAYDPRGQWEFVGNDIR